MRNIFSVVFLVLNQLSFAQENCETQINSWQAGERITYQISYNMGPIWLDAGSVTFSVDADTCNEQPCYYFSGKGGTYPNYDWIYRVRDHYESWATPTLTPLQFVRNVREGKSIVYNTYWFDTAKEQAIVEWNNNGKGQRIGKDTIAFAGCNFDVLTAIYYCRNLDFDTYSVNDTIPLRLTLDRQTENTYLRYLGKDSHTTREGNSIDCIVFKPLLIEGTIFEGGENMEVWVSDDVNRVPVFIKSSILVGAIKVTIQSTEGLNINTDYR